MNKAVKRLLGIAAAALIGVGLLVATPTAASANSTGMSCSSSANGHSMTVNCYTSVAGRPDVFVACKHGFWTQYLDYEIHYVWPAPGVSAGSTFWVTFTCDSISFPSNPGWSWF